MAMREEGRGLVTGHMLTWMGSISIPGHRFSTHSELSENVKLLRHFPMRQEPLERDINIAVSGCSGFATSTQKGP